MTRPPPTSTLFPYTTLFRSHKEAVERVGEYAMGLLGEGVLKGGAPLHPVTEARRIRIRDGERRSEEHTSELQSRFDLVCRLLLEKKNTYQLRTNDPAATLTL